MESETDQLYNAKSTYERLLKEMKNWKATKKNKKVVEKYMGHCDAEGLSYTRRVKILRFLKLISEWIDTDFEKATKDDITKLMSKIRGKEYAPASIEDFIVILKKMFKVVFGDNEEYPKNVKWLKATIPKHQQKPRNNVFTIEDIEKMIAVADNLRNKAYIAFHFESCCRPAEVINIKLKDVKPYEHGFEVTVSGKTGSRPLFIIQSRTYLSEWLNSHPKKDDPNAPLFINLGNGCFGEKLGHAGGNKILKKLYKKAELNSKPCNLYWLRHSGITHKRVMGVSDSALESYAGWVAGSKRIRTYSHLTGRECKDEIERLHGIKKDTEPSRDKNKACYVCKALNGFAETYCVKCGSPLDINKLLASGRKTKEMTSFESFLTKVLTKNPEIVKLIVDKIVEEPNLDNVKEEFFKILPD